MEFLVDPLSMICTDVPTKARLPSYACSTGNLMSGP